MTTIEDHLARAARHLRRDVGDVDVDDALSRVTRRPGTRTRSRRALAPLLVAAVVLLFGIVALTAVALDDDPTGERSVIADGPPATATTPPAAAAPGPTDIAFVVLGRPSSTQAPGSMVYVGVDRALADQWRLSDATPPPTVDFDHQVVLLLTTEHEDGCPEQLVALRRDGDTSVRPMFSSPPVAASCPPLPQGIYTSFVAVERADLPPRFTLVLPAAADDGYPEQRLDVDLGRNFASSTPSTAGDDTAELDTAEPDDPPVAADPPSGIGSDLEAPQPGREITFDGAGDVRLDQALDPSLVTSFEGGGSCGYWGPGEPSHDGAEPLGGLAAGADSDAPKILSIMIRSSNGDYRTASGVGIGTTLDSLRRVYGDRLVIDRADGWETRTNGLLASYGDVAAVRYGDAALTFLLDGDVVDTVKVSHADFWGDDEGCA